MVSDADRPKRDAPPLAGRRAVVTGASRGIGAAIAEALAAAGAHVASLSLGTAAELDAAEEQIRTKGAGVDTLLVSGSTADADAVESLAAEVEARWGGIDIWVNNAAIGFGRDLVDTTPAQWREVMAVNLDGYFYGCQAAARRMIAQRSGRIVNVASITARQPMTSLTAYASAKGAVISLTRALALELAPHGITVNAVSPGAVETQLSGYSPAQRAGYERRIPLGRIAQPGDIAGAVAYLAGDGSAYVTGQELVVDGGLTINGDVEVDGDA